MTFEILPNAAWFFSLVGMVAVVTGALLVAVTARFITVNHRERMARRESIPEFYGQGHFVLA